MIAVTLFLIAEMNHPYKGGEPSARSGFEFLLHGPAALKSERRSYLTASLFQTDFNSTPNEYDSSILCWACILAALLLMGMFVSSNANAQTAPFVSKTLANGLDVIVVENHMVPLVTIELVAKNGSFTEPPQYNGLSHLYEHMFFKANQKLPSQEQFMNGRRSWAARSSAMRRPIKSM